MDSLKKLQQLFKKTEGNKQLVHSMADMEFQLDEAQRDEIARLLKTSPEAMMKFEEEYQKTLLETPENFFKLSAVQAKENIASADKIAGDMVKRIVDELLEKTEFYDYDGKSVRIGRFPQATTPPVTCEEINSLPPDMRPDLTGTLLKRDMPGSCEQILWYYNEWLKEGDSPKGKEMYELFRQGLDILDVDPIVYDIIGTNPNSMGHWLPQLATAVQQQDFFKVPATRIVQLPIPLLQLAHLEYEELTSTTRAIVDQYCMKAFELDTRNDYFVKTGTYSSKFLFRNAHVPAGKEVTELGEYLLFIHSQALEMAGFTVRPKPIYGASTTNEWVVREYIHDKENNPCIYQGMPLHTEYRVFVDFDTDSILGVNPYWDPQVMKNHFAANLRNDPDSLHDYMVYSAFEKTLMERYHKNVEKVCAALQNMLPFIEMSGQWSVDIMQNGEDFYLIDMALAQNSALIKCVPKNLLKPVKENWLPKQPMNLRR